MAEVANNVIYRQTIAEDGNTFRCDRADKNVEFVASKDTWFRPVNLYNAPDGTLYVLDMYREFIEHPWSIPDDIHARLDLRSGNDRGRIYRLAPPRFKPQPFEALGGASAKELVAKLASPRAWYRETAQRLLVERGDKSVVPELNQVLASDQPRAVVHALWTLSGLNSLTADNVLFALQHSSPHVVEQAIRLAEPYLTANEKVQAAVVAQCTATSPRVRLQAALSLGSIDNQRSLDALTQLAERDGTDPWMRAAVCSATPKLVPQLLQRLLQKAPTDTHAIEAITDALLQTCAAMNDPSVIASILKLAREQAPDAQGLKLEDNLWRSLFQYARRKGVCLHDYFDEKSRQALEVAALIQQAEQATQSNALPIEARQAAVARLTLGPVDLAADKLLAVVDQSVESALAVTAIQAVGTYKAPSISRKLIERLKAMTPLVRDEALAVLLARPDRSLALLEAIEEKRLRLAYWACHAKHSYWPVQMCKSKPAPKRYSAASMQPVATSSKGI